MSEQPPLTEAALLERVALPYRGLDSGNQFTARVQQPQAQSASAGKQAIPPATNPVIQQPESRPESWLESRLESKLTAKVVRMRDSSALGKLALAQGLGHQSVSGEPNRQIRRLLDSGLIKYTLPDKPNSRLQQYRLTAQGKALLK